MAGRPWWQLLLVVCVVLGTRGASARGRPAKAPLPADTTRTALLRVDYDEWGSDCICRANCHELDSLFLRVKVGDAFAPRRLASESYKTLEPFLVTRIEPDGRVHVRVPPRLFLLGGVPGGAAVESGPSAVRLGDYATNLGTHSSDAGLDVSLRVITALPPAAALGYPTGPKQDRRRAWDAPRIPDRRDPTTPAGYDGPDGAVFVTVWRSRDGLADSVAIQRSVDPRVDSLAAAAVRRWHVIGGLDCDGAPYRRFEVSISFAKANEQALPTTSPPH